MAQYAREMLEADVGIGLTGVAEPAESFYGLGTGGASPETSEPWGTVRIAIALPGDAFGSERVRHFATRLPPRRELIRRRAVSTALIELRRLLNPLS